MNEKKVVPFVPLLILMNHGNAQQPVVSLSFMLVMYPTTRGNVHYVGFLEKSKHITLLIGVSIFSTVHIVDKVTNFLGR